MTQIFEEIKKQINYEFPSNVSFIKHDGNLNIKGNGKTITVYYSEKRHIVRASLILKSNGTNIPLDIEEKNSFEDVCLMTDCSRNAVLNIETAKNMIFKSALLGYNSFMLYTEDTYEVNNEPEFGYLRGKYTKNELKELNAYANSIGIELIPCIQVLAHLQGLKRWYKEYMSLFDIDDILLCGGERVKKLIENIFATISECFTSKRVHIGMDEAPNVGRGAYLDQHGYRSSFDILTEHLDFISSVAKQYGYNLMMWSDMFFKTAYKENCKGEDGDPIIPKKVIDKIPDNVTMCHWDYRDSPDESYCKNFKIHRCFKNGFWYAGSSFKCFGFFPSHSYSMRGIKLGLTVSKEYGVKSVINTLWGDNGGECSVFGALPCTMYFSYFALGKSLEDIKKDFFTLTGIKFDDYAKLEYPNTKLGEETRDVCCPSSYFLYNDLFSGQFDCYSTDSYVNSYIKSAKILKKLAKCEYGYIFKTSYSLCEVLAIKCDLGVKLRKSYQNNNIDELNEIITKIKLLLKKLRIFLKNVRYQWHKENKPNGLEIQEYRIGGLYERLKGCLKILEDYVNGKINDIPELNEKLLDDVLASCSKYRFMYNSFLLSFSNNNP